MALWAITKPFESTDKLSVHQNSSTKEHIKSTVISPKPQASLKSRKTVLSKTSGWEELVWGWTVQGSPLSPHPTPACTWMDRSAGCEDDSGEQLWWPLHFQEEQLSGRKPKLIAKEELGEALRPGICSMCALRCDSQAGGELHEKCPLRDQKEHMAPRCFDPVFKDAPWASCSFARQSPGRALPSACGRCWGCGPRGDRTGASSCLWGASCSPQPTYETSTSFYWLQTQRQSQADYDLGPKPVELHRRRSGMRLSGMPLCSWSGCCCAPSLKAITRLWLWLLSATRPPGFPPAACGLWSPFQLAYSSCPWHKWLWVTRGDLSPLQAPRRARWPAQPDPGSVNHFSVCWGRLNSWELWEKPPLEVNREVFSRLILSFCCQRFLRRCIGGHWATQQSSQGVNFFLPPTWTTLNWRQKFPRATLVSRLVWNSRR